MEGKHRLEQLLRDNKVAFEIHHHPQAFTAQEVAASEHVPGRMLGKVVAIKADDRLVLAVVPAPATVDPDKVALAVGATEARLAEEREFSGSFPDCDVGAMPPFGNGILYDVPVIVDRQLASQQRVVFNACTHTDTVHLAWTDFESLVKPEVADITV